MIRRQNETWTCHCGAVNDCTDAACECQYEAERKETKRRLIIARLGNLSPRERRERVRA